MVYQTTNKLTTVLAHLTIHERITLLNLNYTLKILPQIPKEVNATTKFQLSSTTLPNTILKNKYLKTWSKPLPRVTSTISVN